MNAEVTPAPTRGRPRQAGLGRRIRAAAGAELLANGVGAFSVSAVARRAGLAKGTISLRYPHPLDLMVDAISDLFYWEPVPDLGDLRSELLTLADRLVDSALSYPLFGLSQSVLASAAAQPEVWPRYVNRIVGAGLSLAKEVLTRGVARGEVPRSLDLDAVVAAFVGGLQMVAEADATMTAPSAQARESLVTVVLAACAGASHLPVHPLPRQDLPTG